MTRIAGHLSGGYKDGQGKQQPGAGLVDHTSAWGVASTLRLSPKGALLMESLAGPAPPEVHSPMTSDGLSVLMEVSAAYGFSPDYSRTEFIWLDNVGIDGV
jgi:hypothetical protein